MSLKFGQIRTRTTQLSALGEMVSPQVFSAVLVWILFIRAGNDDLHKSLADFKIRQNLTTDYGVSST